MEDDRTNGPESDPTETVTQPIKEGETLHGHALASQSITTNTDPADLLGARTAVSRGDFLEKLTASLSARARSVAAAVTGASGSSSAGCDVSSSAAKPSTEVLISKDDNDATDNQQGKPLVPLDMMPTIPLIPVQLPLTSRIGMVTVPSKSRGRPRGLCNQFGTLRSALSVSSRSRMRAKRVGSTFGRGQRRLLHSISLDERLPCSSQDELGMHDEELHFSHDDMYPATLTYQEKWPGKSCAFCALGEASQFGHGGMVKYEPSSDFSASNNFSEEDGNRFEASTKKLKSSQFTFKDQLHRSTRKPMTDLTSDSMDELASVGHLEKPCFTEIFSNDGHCFAHGSCAVWATGVELRSDGNLTGVDRAAIDCLKRKCQKCQKLGASVSCKATGCDEWYHFPCATSIGAVMDLKNMIMFCPTHTDQAKALISDRSCNICDNDSPETSLLFCCSCGQHYHGGCLKPSVKINPVTRCGWQCPECKSCQMCRQAIHRQASDEVVCGVCDRAYHIKCARPQGLTHPRNDWKCKACRVCSDCGSKTPGNGLSSKWHVNFSVCDSCYQLRNKGLACPICKKAYRAIMQKTMAQCSICKRYVHNHCDADADLGIIQAKMIGDSSYEYNCTVCRTSPTARLQAATMSCALGTTESLAETISICEDSVDNELGSDDVPPSPRKSQASQFTGLSLLANSSHTYNASSSHPNLSSLYNRGKPFVSRRGGFLSRGRGSTAVSKFNLGKKSLNSRARGGGKSGLHATRRSRGSGSKNYRSYFNYQPAPLQVMDNNHSTGKEEGEENKMIIVNSDRTFCLMQDICTMCGGFGQDQEGRLLACAQCGQCYHPSCIKLTVSKVMLEKGWRCLDCTVCEGCGERHDESRLVLCEDCDISWHIYCMNPPLDQVPAGIWKCKWCAVCQRCGTKEPGINSSWKENYSLCGPCSSMTTCSLCDEAFKESDLLICCFSCNRWLHAADDSINTAEEAERCTRQDYFCPMCRSPDVLPPHILSSSPNRKNERERHNSSSLSLSCGGAGHSNSTSHSPNRSNSPLDYMPKVNLNSNASHVMDGTCLSDMGLHQIQNLTLPPVKKPRKGLRASRGMSIDSTGSKDFDDDDEEDEDRLKDKIPNQQLSKIPRHWVCGMKEGALLLPQENGDPPVLPEGYYTLPGPAGDQNTFVLRKKRHRNIKTVGIGGFQVKGRGKKEENKAKEEAELDPEKLEMRRKRSKWRTKKKIPLLDKFPSYIQEAFFGMNLMDTKALGQENRSTESTLEETVEEKDSTPSEKTSIRLSQDEVNLVNAAKEKHEQLQLRKTEELLPSHPEPSSSSSVNNQSIVPSFPKKECAPKHGTISIKVEEKPKEEKVEDLVEAEEFEALFGAGGGAFLTDDIVLDLMKDDIKDETDKDPIDSDAGGQLTDLLGPGFNLEDVADIMKNLPEEASGESQSGDQSMQTVSVSDNSVQQPTTASSPANVTPPLQPQQPPQVQSVSSVSSAVVHHPPNNPYSLTAAAMSHSNLPTTPMQIASTQGVAVPSNPIRPGLGTQPQNMLPQNVVYQPRPAQYMQDGSSQRVAYAEVPQGHILQKALVPGQQQKPVGLQLHNKIVMGAFNQGPSNTSQLINRPVQQQAPIAPPYPSPISYTTEASLQSPSLGQEQPKTWAPSESQSLSLSLEEDEALGDKATKAAVLYTNIHKPSLKSESNSVLDRERQIKRVWKNLDAEQRKTWTQKARENKKEYFKNKQEHQRAMKSQEKDVVNPPITNHDLKSMQPSQCLPQNYAAMGQQMQRFPMQRTPKRTIVGMPGAIVQTSSAQGIRVGVASGKEGGQVTLLRHQTPFSGGQMIQQGVQSLVAPNNGASGMVSKTNQLDMSSRQTPNELVQTSSPGYTQGISQDSVCQIQKTTVSQANMLRDVLQKPTHSWDDSTPSRPQFRQPLPPLSMSSQVRLRLQFPQGMHQRDPRFRQLLQQPRMHPQQSLHQSRPIGQPYSNTQTTMQPNDNNQQESPSQSPIVSKQENRFASHNTPSSQPATSASELPESVTRDLESLAQTTTKEHSKNDIEDIEATTDLPHMDVDLLSSFESELKDFWDIADEDSEKNNTPDEKLPSNFFANIDEVSKDSDGEKSSATNAGQVKLSPALQYVQTKARSSPGQSSPADNPGTPATPGTPGTKSPLTMGPSPCPIPGSPRMALNSSPQSQLQRSSPHMPHINPSFQNASVQRPNVSMAPGIRHYSSMQASNKPQMMQRPDGPLHINSQHQFNSTMQQTHPAVSMHQPVQGGMQRPPGPMVMHRPQSNVSHQHTGHSVHPPMMGTNHMQQTVAPPPYNCNPSGNFSKPDVMPGDCLMIRTPLGSPVGMGSPMMRPHHHSQIVGNPSLMMGPHHRMPSSTHMTGALPHRRSLLLQEQPLIIEDIIEAEKREQMQNQKNIVGQHGGASPNISHNFNEGPTIRSMYQGTRFASPGPNSPMFMGASTSQHIQRPIRPPTDPGLHPALIQAGARPSHIVSNPSIGTIKLIPPPPVPCDNPQTESDLQQQANYEKWLSQQQQIIQTQLSHAEAEIAKLRKLKKSLSSRQRTLKKNGQELSEHDQKEFDRVQKEMTTVQRQVETCRKNSRQHSNISSEYNNKRRSKHMSMLTVHSSNNMIPAGQQMLGGGMPMGQSPSPLHSTPQSPMMSHSPSSQHSLGMSPMVSSPHTPAASPGQVVVPQHSPHGMGVPSALPSPIDHGPFSPRMHSPGTPGSYTGQAMNHHMMLAQGMKVRMPAHSPGASVVQSGPVSPHMMQMKQGYQQVSNMMGQVPSQQMMLRHSFPQGSMPMRRPSGSGPIQSPSSSQGGLSPMHGAPPMSPITNIGMKPSPVHSGGLRSPIPLASPQMRPHSSENPGTPLTPRSAEAFSNPLTPNDPGTYCTQINSPHHPMLTPTPPSPAMSNQNSGNLQVQSSECPPVTGHNDPMVDISRMPAHSSGGGPGIGANLPIPACQLRDDGVPRLGLRGGQFKKSRWGHIYIGLKGGSPTADRPCTITSTKTSGAAQSSFSTSSVMGSMEGANVMSVRAPMSSGSVAPLTYASAGATIAESVATQLSTSNKILVPEPAKSEIPPSSRHQAVIGIPGGGAISNPVALYTSNPISAASVTGLSTATTLPNYSSINSSDSLHVNSSFSTSGIVSSLSLTTASQLVPAPIMSLSVSDYNVSPLPPNTQLSDSLAKEVNTLVNVVSASSQINNVIVSSNSIGPLPHVRSLSSNLPFIQTMPTTTLTEVISSAPRNSPSLQSSSIAVLPQNLNLVQRSFSSSGVSSRMSFPSNTQSAPNSDSAGGQYQLSYPQTRPTQPHTLHHLPQNKIVVAANSSPLPSTVHIATNHNNANTNAVMSTAQPIVVSKATGSSTPMLIHSSGQTAQQIVQLPSMGTTHNNRPQVLQSMGQYTPLSHTTQGTQLIVQHQQHPGGMVLATSGNHVRMVGQQVMMPQGLLRGNGVMVKAGSQQPGFRMMIHNNKPRTPTPPPVSRQPSPMMPPPSTRSPAPHISSSASRVSPAPSPMAHSPGVGSPQSPLIRPQSHNNSPVPSPHQSSTPPVQAMMRTDGVAEAAEMKPNQPRTDSVLEHGSKDNQDKPAPNVLLKQLLQNASCAGNSVPPGQLLLVRSTTSPGNLALSQLATQVPNASAIPKNFLEIKQQNTHAITGGISSDSTITRPQFQQQTVPPPSVSRSIQGIVGPQGGIYYNGPSVGPNGQRVASALPLRTMGSNVPSATVQSVLVQQTIPGAQISSQGNRGMQIQLTPGQVVVDARSQRPQMVNHYSPSSLTANQIHKVQVPVSNSSLPERLDAGAAVKSELRTVVSENSLAGDTASELHAENIDDTDEVRKAARKRLPSQVRRKSQTKDTKVTTAKRMRQGSRVEEDYDSYIDSTMSHLRAMPPLVISEPDVPQTINQCPMLGGPYHIKAIKKEMSVRKGMLLGSEEGNLWIKGLGDYYNTQPFGPKAPMVLPAKSTPQKGFYNQEFNPPKIGFTNEDYQYDSDGLGFTKQIVSTPRDAGSPDTVLSSSSPECVMPDSPPPFRGLKLIDMEEDLEDHKDRSTSPMIPILAPVPTYKVNKPLHIYSKYDKENEPTFMEKIAQKSKVGYTPALPLKSPLNMSVSLTLTTHAAQDVSHVLRSLANLLNIAPPPTYELSNFPIEHTSKFRRHTSQRSTVDGKVRKLDLQNMLNGRLPFCKSCNCAIINNSIVKSREEIPAVKKEIWNGLDHAAFCSKSCCQQFIENYRLDAALPPTYADSVSKNKEDLPLNLRDSNLKYDSKTKIPLTAAGFLKRKFDSAGDSMVPEKRQRKSKFRYWNRDEFTPPDDYEKPSDKEMTDLLFRLQITYRQQGLPDDSRQCTLCHLYGDYLADGPSRLLNYDVDKWVHLNCVLWCEDVYETLSGSLMLAEVGLKKALTLTCVHCDQVGASVKCFKARCNKFYHLNCAVKEGCTFYMNKTVYCQEHINKGDKDNELPTLAVHRRVFIERDESRQIASVMHHTEMNQVLRIGSLILINIGLLLPHQLQAFHTPYCLYPVGYQAIRFYWSMNRLNKRCAYWCSIHEVDGQPQFQIIVKEDGNEDVILKSRSPKGVWNKILEPIAELRQRNNLVKLFPQYISGEDLFGLTEPAIVRILESMPGVDSLPDYTFKYGSNPLFELPLAVNPSGSARSEPYNRTVTKRHHGIRTTVGSVKTANNPRTAAAMASISIAMDPFVPFGKPYTHSRFFGYKKMKNEWRSNVYLARSKIQGLGLYAARDIEKNTMIIEYIGEIIRSELSEIREKRYEAQHRGIYMFRLDDARVVDATVSGGLARYINHCCDPNCYTETVEVEKDFKIMIISNRKIMRGEELAYDYKFDEEEDHKIPCLCGAENCRKWMN